MEVKCGIQRMKQELVEISMKNVDQLATYLLWHNPWDERSYTDDLLYDIKKLNLERANMGRMQEEVRNVIGEVRTVMEELTHLVDKLRNGMEEGDWYMEIIRETMEGVTKVMDVVREIEDVME